MVHGPRTRPSTRYSENVRIMVCIEGVMFDAGGGGKKCEI
jgi:hypothetical protein